MIKVADIINTRGLKGEIKLNIVTDDLEDRFKKGRTLYIDKEIPVTVKSFNVYKGFGYCTFKEIKDINEAEKWKTHSLWIKKSDLPKLDDGTFYYHELMGCTCLNEKNENCGVVSDILETGAHIVLRVSKDDTSFLMPFVPAFIQSVNPDEKIIIFTEMEGLR